MFWLIKPMNFHARKVWIHFNAELALFYSTTKTVDVAKNTSYEVFMAVERHSYIGVKI